MSFTDTREKVVEIIKGSAYFPVFLKLVVTQKPEQFGPQPGLLNSVDFFKDLDELEAWIASHKFVSNENDFGKLIALKNHLFLYRVPEIKGIRVFESPTDEIAYLRRLLSFVSKLKKLKPVQKKDLLKQLLTILKQIAFLH